MGEWKTEVGDTVDIGQEIGVGSGRGRIARIKWKRPRNRGSKRRVER